MIPGACCRCQGLAVINLSNFCLVMNTIYTCKLDGKNLIWGAQPPTWLSTLVCCTSILLYAKMLEETETEKNITLYCFYFYHWWHFNWEGGFTLLPPPPWLRVWRGRFIKALSWEILFVYCLQYFYWIYRWSHLSPKLSLWNIFCQFFKKKKKSY